MPNKNQKSVTISVDVFDRASHMAKAKNKSIAGFVTSLIEQAWKGFNET